MTATAELNVFNCTLGGTTLIEASAGTGKTWNICGLYLRLLLEKELSVQQILVVTFTNAATAELRERIRSRIAETVAFLNDSGAPGGDPFVPALIEAVEESKGIARDKIVKILDLALQTFDEAAIFTIHGFCQRALADTPFASGMPFANELVQDDTANLMEAVHDFWRRHISGAPLSPQLATYLLQQNDSPQKFARLLKRHLSKPKAQYLWPQEAGSDIAATLGRIGELYGDAKATWKRASADIVTLLENALPDLKSAYSEEAIKEAANAWNLFFAGDEPPRLTLRGFKAKAFRSSDLAKGTKAKKATPSHPFFDQAEVLLEELPDLQQRVEDELTCARLALVRTLLEKGSAELRKRKREKRVTAFDDILFNVYDALDSGNYPWLASALRSRYPAALIDEFQDTDPLQFAIFDAIYGGTDIPVFLVGDPKQAIYSFRNADLHTYLHAKEKTSSSHTLSGNQRSSKGLIEGLNALFGANHSAFMLPGLDYQRVNFGDKPRKQFVDSSEPRADLQLWMLPANGEHAIDRGNAKRASVNATAAEIARLVTEARCGKITLDGRPLRPGDIAVLVRSHTQGSAIRSALAALNIASVELSQASVFDSPDAADLERILCAVMEPARVGLLLAALATPVMGCDAAEIAAIAADERRLMACIDRFTAYREMWFTRGVGFMYRQLMAGEGVSSRMLCRPDGERRLTNLLHLGEHLHQAALQYRSPDAMLRWLQTRRRDETADEAAQLRLESDENLVQIVTVHKSKGLEYPVVFCPFLWDNYSSNRNDNEGREYHAEDGANVIDFRTEADTVDRAKEAIRLEQSAETLRLIYVALTRAAHRCYLVAGSYSRMMFGKPSTKEGTRSLLNWLVAGDGMSPQEWFDAALTPAEIDDKWAALVNSAVPSVPSVPYLGLSPLPMDAGKPVSFERPSAAGLAALAPPPPVHDGWRMGSFSSLQHGASSERAASDHDGRITGPVKKTVAASVISASIADDDILGFPRGPGAGDCLHAVFEEIDFSRPETWERAISDALTAYPQPATEKDKGAQHAKHTAMVLHMLRDVLSTHLPDGVALETVTPDRRLMELEFHLPSRRITADGLNRTLNELGYDVPHLTFRSLEGYLTGFIDMVFEHDGRYYIADWKSNHLGTTPDDYGPDAVAEAMVSHGYHLQYLLYSVALHRYLAQRIPNYSYETHFGGVFYLFVRGVRPEWKLADGSQAGVFFHRPAAATLKSIEGLLDPVALLEAAA